MKDFFKNLSYIFLQPTKSCNISCDFCYAREVDQSVEGNWVETFIEEFNYSINQINFHGGEPLMVGWKKLEKMISTLRKRGHNKKIKIQTNFFLMDQNIVDITKDYDVHVGTSFNIVGRPHAWQQLDKYATKLKFPLSAVTIVNRDITTNYIDYLMKEIFPKYEIIEYNFEMYKPINKEDFDLEDFNHIENIHKYLFDNYVDNGKSNKYILKPFVGGMWGCENMNCLESVRSISPDGKVYLCNYAAGINYSKPIADISKGIIYHEEISRIKAQSHLGCVYRGFGVDGLDPCKNIYNKIHSWQNKGGLI